MKNKKCPEKKFCFGYKDNNCEGCTFGEEITKLHKRIDRLKKQKETLTIQRNAWALIAKRLIEDGKWISVEERLPEDNQEVITYSSSGEIEVLIYDNHDIKDTFVKYGALVRVYNVTHWMTIPKPPKESEDTE